MMKGYFELLAPGCKLPQHLRSTGRLGFVLSKVKLEINCNGDLMKLL